MRYSTNLNKKIAIDRANISRVFKCEKITKMRFNKALDRKEYNLKWLYFPPSMNTWEPYEMKISCKF